MFEKIKLVVHKTPKEAVSASLVNDERVFVEPYHYLSNFSLLKFHRYLVLPIPKKLYYAVERKKIKNVNEFEFNNLSKIKEPIKNTPFNILKRNLYKQAENNIKTNLENLSENKILNLTTESFILFSWFLKEKNIDIKEIELVAPYLLEELIDRGIKGCLFNFIYKPFYPFSLERAIKLYGILYLSKESNNSTKVKFISNLQEHLQGIKHINEFNPHLLEKAIFFFKEESDYFEKVLKFPLDNLINKIVEEFLILDFLKNQIDENEIEKGKKYGFDYFLPKKNIQKDFEKKLKEYIFFEGQKCPVLSPF